MNVERKKLTPTEVATIYGVAPETVIAWIVSGELEAINVASRNSRRPRYRVDLEDLRRFDQRRKVATASKAPRRTRSTQPKDYIEFY